MIVAAALKQPLAAIDMEEATSIAEAVLLVSAEYGVKLTGKTAVSLNLLVTLGIIYGQKAYIIMTADKPQAAQQPAAQVIKPPAFDASNIARPNWNQ